LVPGNLDALELRRPERERMRNVEQRMARPTILVRAAPPQGYRWNVIVDGETVGSGTAATEFDARNAADEIVKRLEAKPPQGA
jgi:hypothetical protein